MKTTYLLALLFCAATSMPSLAGESVPATEYCGKNSSATPRRIFSWDCSDISAKSVSELEGIVQNDSFKLSEAGKSVDLKIYESETPHFSAWVFFPDQTAVRYRALFDGDRYKGIGITAFCQGSQRDCSVFESSIALTAPPMPLMFKLGPPPPELPPVVQ